MSFTYEYSAANLAKLTEAINFLNTIKEPAKIIESQSGYEAVFCIGKYIGFSTNNISYDQFIEKNMDTIFGDLLLYLYEKHTTYDFQQGSISGTTPTPNANYNEKCITIFCMATYSCNLIMSNLLKFKLAFQRSNGLKGYLKMLGDESFVNRNLNNTMNPFNSATLYIIDYLTLNLSSISINCQDFKDVWHGLDSVNILMKIASKRSTSKEYAFNVILNIGNLFLFFLITDIDHHKGKFNSYNKMARFT